jgi:hypothetical protein
MSRSKFLMSILLAMLLLATQAAYAGAAPAVQEDTPIKGNIDSIILETDSEGEITVVVTLGSENEEPQTIRLSLEYARDELGLVGYDENGKLVVVGVAGAEVEINPAEVIVEDQEKEHPVGSALSGFFSELLGVDYETVMAYHDDGMGFGTIAQALWMTKALNGNTEMFGSILDAKRNGDYSQITLPDGSEPENWGQFRKAVMSDQEKSKENLGAIMSGRANDDGIGSSDNGKANNGKGPLKNKDKGKGKEKNK